MRCVVLALAAASLLNLVACTPQRPAEEAATPPAGEAATVAAAEPANAGDAENEAIAAAPAGAPQIDTVPDNGAEAAAADAPMPADQDGATDPAAVERPGEAAARDAREAAEQAAHKIFDATRGAATLLKEAGQEAVQSVRQATAGRDAE